MFYVPGWKHGQKQPNNGKSATKHFQKFQKNLDKDSFRMVSLDFAGVENEFNCIDTSVLNDFMKIEADDGSGLFYKNEK